MNNLYLDLILKCLINTIYEDPPIQKLNDFKYNEEIRNEGYDFPSLAHTMIGKYRMENIRKLAEQVIKEDINGDFVETGVWRGGACIFMRAILKAYNITNRKVWCVDSFEGLPKPEWPQDKDDKHYIQDHFSVSIEKVKSNFEKYNLLDNQVIFLKGWFKDILPKSPINQISLLRLDGDMFASTMITLQSLYNQVSSGGFVIIDDYKAIRRCGNAVDLFREKERITNPLVKIDKTGYYWRKI